MQKKLKTLGMVLLAFTLTAAVGVSVNTETASAKKVNAKTLKLKKKTLKLKVGDSSTLKTTVKPKKATLKWKSSKKKVVTVSKKGKVTAKKEGTAKITVTSGKKKATCTVTVKGYGKKAVSIKSVSVVNSKVVRVTLSKAKKLTAKDFAVSKSVISDAKNKKKLTVASVSNSKNKVYTLVLATNYDVSSDDNDIDDGNYVFVTIKKLNGLNTKDTVYYASPVAYNQYVGGRTNSILNDDVYFTADYKGYLSGVKVSGLPAGLRAEVHDNYVTIKGVPTAVANGTQATMTAKDELGKSLTQKVLFYIGSDTQIVSYVPVERRTILANDNSSDYFQIRAYGGTGSRTYSLPGNTNKFVYIDESDGEITFASSHYNETTDKSEKMPAGKYNVAYSITDSANHTAKGSVAVTAVNGVKITGNLTAGDNTLLSSGNVSANFKDINHVYSYNSTESWASVISEDSTIDNVKRTKGSYELVVAPGQSYDLEARSGGARTGITNLSVGNANLVQNFKLPLYKVTFASSAVNVKDTSFEIDGIDGSGYKSYNTTDTYLKKGTYVVNETSYDRKENGFTTTTSTYKLSAVFTVNGNMTVNLTSTKVSDSTVNQLNDTPLVLDESRSVSEYYDYDDGYNYYKFTPSEAGQYVIESNRSQTVWVYDTNKKLIGSYFAEDKDDNYQTVISNLNANTTYVFGFINSDIVTVKKYVPAAPSVPDDTDTPTEE
ncbi:MAG: Ig-like domain-containing protein [Lachnospiraceae bacterium]|nr:Ig-like domain-containing protein [Lachnospiraceae bacterium]